MKKLLVPGVLGLLCAGCVSAPFQPPPGLFETTKAPLSTQGNWKVGAKEGRSSVSTYLGLISTGDCSISAAARAGGLTKVDYVDYEYENYIGVYQKTTVVVYGE